MSKKSVMKQAWEEMKEEYFRQHPDAGVVFWDVPPEQQPIEYKEMLYDIIWNLVHKDNGGK